MTTTQKGSGTGLFDHGAVRVVDYNSSYNNILVRGCSAFGALRSDGEPVSLSHLVKVIQHDVNFASTGITLGSSPMVIDICLIGFGSGDKDEGIVQNEIGWFTDSAQFPNGNSGPYPVYFSATKPGITAGTTMIYWPIQALGGTPPSGIGGTWSISPANTIGPGVDNEGFNFSGLIWAIRNALQGQTASLPNAPASLGQIRDAIIYVHCDSGVNRTGAAVAGYLMTFGSNLAALRLPSSNGVPYSLADAQTAAYNAPPDNDKPIGGSDLPVTQAYCNYVYTKNMDGTLIEACLIASN